MNWRLLLRNALLHLTTASLLAAACLLFALPFVRLHPVAVLVFALALTSFVLGLAYEPLKRRLQPVIDRVLFANQFSYLEVLGRLPKDLQEFTNLREMLDYLVTHLKDAAKLERVRVFMHDPGHQSYVEMVFRGSARGAAEPSERPTQLLETSPLILCLLEDNHLWVIDDLKSLSNPDTQAAYLELQSLGGGACFPINKENELLGLVVLGPKRSGADFNQEDLKILRALRLQLESFLTQAMVLTQEALNMVKESHDMKNDVNALKGRASWRAMRLAAWWLDFEKEIDKLAEKLGAESLALLKQRTAEFYTDTKRALPIEEHAITRLAHHLRNWTEFGRIVAEGFRGRRPLEKVDVGETARLSVDRWMPMAEQKQLELTVEISSPLFIWGDRNLLEQIIENLIDNAVKATETGYVQVVCQQEDPNIVVEVRDSGCGIPQEDVATIFDKPFYHGRNRAKIEPGSGVGLYLVGQYARSLGGRVSMESRVGKGSTVRVALPAYRKEPQKAEVAA